MSLTIWRHISVHPDHKGKGLGRALVDFLTDHQKTSYGISHQKVTVGQNSQMVIPFYERMGFVNQGLIPSWYQAGRDDNLNFERDVEELSRYQSCKKITIILLDSDF